MTRSTPFVPSLSRFEVPHNEHERRRVRAVAKLSCCVALVFLLVGAAARSAIGQTPASDAGVAPSPDTVTRYYSLTVRLRPFLIWMTRDDVGGARISWNPSPGPDRWVELLVGSDPDRAPMAINRWGFIAEQTKGDTTSVTGIMTETDDDTIDGARGNAAAMANGRAFRVIRSTIRNGDATTSVGRLVVDSEVTYRSYAALLDGSPIASGRPQHLRVAAGVEPGFLTALRSVVHGSVQRWQRTPGAAPAGLARDYVYSGKLYRLSLQSATVVNETLPDGRRAIEGQFEIRNLSTGTTIEFRMRYGLSGSEAEMPLRVVYRPRWWVELQLDLVSDRDPSRKTVAMSQMSPPHNPNVPR